MNLDRKQQIKEILYYVDNHRDSHLSRNVCAKILGETERATIDDEMVRELKIKLPNVKQEEVQAIFNAVH
jgi:hypothetical protein